MGEKRRGMAFRRMVVRALAVAMLAGGLAAVPQAGAHGGLARPGMSDARLLRVETQVLGRTHALEHLRARREARRLAAHPPPKVKRTKLAGDASLVGHWSDRYEIDVTGIHAILLPTGKVLLFSYGSTENTSIATLWDPATHTGKRIATPQQNIWCAGQTLLADGRVLVVGGNIPKGDSTNYRGLDSIWIFDPWEEKWIYQGRMNDGRWYPTSTLLPDGRVVITSGFSADGSGRINTDVELFTPSPDRTKPGTITTVGSHSFNLYPFQFVLRDGRVLIAGPFRSDHALLDPATWDWDALPALQGDHYYGSAVLLPDGPSGSSKVMVIGGDGQTSTEVIDAENLGAGWKLRKPLPEARRNANSVLTADGAIITIGGNGLNNYEEPRFEALRYDPAADTWSHLAAQQEERGYHSTALLLPDGRILSAGDDGPDGGGGASDEIEVFSPPYLFKGARPAIMSAPDEVGYGAAFSVTTSGEAPARAVLMAPGATTHANDMHQRLVALAMTPGGAGRIELTSPANRAIAPPGYYELVLVSAAGVPSEARFLRLGDDAVEVPAPPPAGGAGPTVPVTGAGHGGLHSTPSTTGTVGPPASFAPLSYWRLGFENPLAGVSRSALVSASHSGRKALWVGSGVRVDSPRMVAGRYRVTLWARSGPPRLTASAERATLRLRMATGPGMWRWRRMSATVRLSAGPQRVILRLAPGGRAIVDDLVLSRLGR
jgi:Domain of unknown function (DUF1929)